MTTVAALVDPDVAFRVGNGVALLGWVLLAVATPSKRFAPLAWRIAGWGIPLLLAVGYVVLLVVHQGPGGFGSLAEVRQLFDRPGLLAAGWLHYLAFDLFIGTWIARRAVDLRVPHGWLLPVLALTFLFGPAGLLAFAALQLFYRAPTSADGRGQRLNPEAPR